MKQAADAGLDVLGCLRIAAAVAVRSLDASKDSRIPREAVHVKSGI